MAVQNIDSQCFFQEAQIDALHQKIHQHETYPKDEISKTIEIVNAINVQILSPTGLEKFQSLCGRLHRINIKMMVDAILDEAQNLKRSGLKNPEDVEVLHKAIAEMRQNHSLSEEDSNLLGVASITLAELFSEKNLDILSSSESRLTKEREVAFFPEYEKEELAFELLNIAGLFYAGKMKEGLDMLEILRHEIELPQISEKSSPDDIATFIQDAVVKSFEIGRKDGYVPSSLEILELLEEASTLS